MPASFQVWIRHASELYTLRARMRECLETVGASSATAHDVLLVATELVANGLDASPHREARVEFECVDDVIRGSVWNRGPKFEWSTTRTPAAPNPPASTGSGLELVAAVAPTTTVSQQGGFTVARFSMPA
jgi:anti-sigma regulatory factor (Ser/Thr protein kinase)